MKLLTIAIPCYNSAAYMERCIESLLPGGEEVEILIVDDGSQKDNTAEIADQYEKNYPGICRAIHQENGGHGEAVNTGLRNAQGIFFKVVDSDDWVNGEAYREVLNTLRRFAHENQRLDMLLTNFVYEKQGAKRKAVMNYRTAIPKDELIDWSSVRMFMLGQYILMHSVVYRTELLRGCGPGASQAYLLCGQYFRVPASSARKIHVLSGRELLPLFYWKRRSVCQ